jgi:mono/diheme cytochrome c family protein
VSDDPAGETYWKIEHGIRFTGMPAFVGSLSEEQIWQIAYFLSHGMDKLPPAADAIWTGANGS